MMQRASALVRNRQGLTVRHMDVHAMYQPRWEGSLGEKGHVCVWLNRSPWCSLETVTTLLVNGLYPKYKVKVKKENNM